MRAIIFKYRCNHWGTQNTGLCDNISSSDSHCIYYLVFQIKHFTCKAFLHAINQYQQKNTLKDAKQFLSNSCLLKIQDHFFLFTNLNYLTYKLHNFNTLAVLLSSKMCNEKELHISCRKVFFTFWKIAQQ